MPEPHHLTLPLQLTARRRLSSAPKDSDADIGSAVLGLVRLPLGHIPEAPTLGTPDLNFLRVDADAIAVVRRHVRVVEPRIDLVGDEVVTNAIRLATLRPARA